MSQGLLGHWSQIFSKSNFSLAASPPCLLPPSVPSTSSAPLPLPPPTFPSSILPQPLSLPLSFSLLSRDHGLPTKSSPTSQINKIEFQSQHSFQWQSELKSGDKNSRKILNSRSSIVEVNSLPFPDLKNSLPSFNSLPNLSLSTSSPPLSIPSFSSNSSVGVSITTDIIESQFNFKQARSLALPGSLPFKPSTLNPTFPIYPCTTYFGKEYGYHRVMKGRLREEGEGEGKLEDGGQDRFPSSSSYPDFPPSLKWRNSVMPDSSMELDKVKKAFEVTGNEREKDNDRDVEEKEGENRRRRHEGEEDEDCEEEEEEGIDDEVQEEEADQEVEGEGEEEEKEEEDQEVTSSESLSCYESQIWEKFTIKAKSSKIEN